MAMMYRDGVEALKDSTRLYGQCCRGMTLTWGLDVSQTPSWASTTEFIQRHGLRTMEAQLDFLAEVWSQSQRKLRREISRRTHTSPLHIVLPSLRAQGYDHGQYAGMTSALYVKPTTRVNDGPWHHLERSARTSLARAVDAFNFLEDTELAEVAHKHAHSVAALVGGIFGCRIEYSEGTYWDTCPISLMHSRCGISVGFTAKRCCSLCGEDLDLCEHLLDTRYEVRVNRNPEGMCNACGRRSCSHHDGDIVLAYPHPVIGDVQLHEISMVTRPRDPLARITKIEIDHQLLAHSLGGQPSGHDAWCYRCLHPCDGFTTLTLQN